MNPLFSIIGGIAGDMFKNMREKRQAKHEVKMTNISNAHTVQTSRISEMSKSWKDEAWTLTFIGVIWMTFLGESDRVLAGFEALAKTPDWFQWGMLTSIAVSFGVKSYNGFKKGKGA
jgi:hypothetical protein